jgi:splicing factor 3B subunit 3
MAATSNMSLYSLTLQPPSNISHAIVGLFSGTREQQILTVSGSYLNLLRPDPVLGNLVKIASRDVFSIIQAVASFRLAGSTKGAFVDPDCARRC